MVLQRDGPARRYTRKLGVFDDRFAVELDGQAVARHGNEHAVPRSRLGIGLHLALSPAALGPAAEYFDSSLKVGAAGGR